MDALIFQEVLYFDEVHSHLDHLLSEDFLALAKEVNLFLTSTQRSLHRQFLLNLALAFLGGGHRHNVALLEEVKKLPWDFLKGLLGQLGRIVLKVTEWNKLNDICLHILLVSL